MKIIVTGEFDERLKIKFSQGTWNVTIFTLFENLKTLDVEFSRDPSLFRLTISYDVGLAYLENVLYLSNPNLDILQFDFYRDANRIFCKISSEIVLELNKEVVLGSLPNGLEEIQKIFENLNDENCASL